MWLFFLFNTVNLIFFQKLWTFRVVCIILYCKQLFERLIALNCWIILFDGKFSHHCSNLDWGHWARVFASLLESAFFKYYSSLLLLVLIHYALVMSILIYWSIEADCRRFLVIIADHWCLLFFPCWQLLMLLSPQITKPNPAEANHQFLADSQPKTRMLQFHSRNWNSSQH